MSYCEKYDCYMKRHSDHESEWKERRCKDEDCEFCKDRPDTPEQCEHAQRCHACEFYQ